MSKSHFKKFELEFLVPKDENESCIVYMYMWHLQKDEEWNYRPQNITITYQAWKGFIVDHTHVFPSRSTYGTATTLVIVDTFSKMLVLINLGDKTNIETIARPIFDNIVRAHGLPRKNHF